MRVHPPGDGAERCESGLYQGEQRMAEIGQLSGVDLEAMRLASRWSPGVRWRTGPAWRLYKYREKPGV